LHRVDAIPANSLKEVRVMQFLITCTLAVVAVLATSQRPVWPEVVPVERVVDGDTIDVGVYKRIHLAGVHAPQVGRRGEPGELLAGDALRRLDTLVGHQFVRLEFPSATSRRSAYVLRTDGTFVNARLVEEGLARVSGHPTGERGEALLRAQQHAKDANLGVWRR
jgi:endonuclease YncB( thermonuclease family)